jgi:hypothetical protein
MLPRPGALLEIEVVAAKGHNAPNRSGADEHGLEPLWSEYFQDGRYYGRVKVQNPFRMAVHEAAARVRPPGD